ncbi:MAG: LPS export ABC transporter periplasmic protein LptC [Gemmatimonadota bacterium]|nr:LPS export ABC transporter periplasmic protein LptC [Gemmatimonadota bacterium]MDP6802279.1 LPS export ABC transporter periplasmic protein LptC [Gemmatimonadota bacterium]MDP7031987.1 LPS export ABC transporter periplasmic protein LptC [Gemmatimonadota bacterium]
MRGRFRREKRLLFYLGVRALRGFVRCVPRRVAHACFALLGDGVRLVDRPAVGRSRTHLNIAYGEELSHAERDRIVRRMFRALGRNVVDLLRMPDMSREDLKAAVRFEGLEHLEEAVATGRGVVALSGHMGNWEILGAALAARGVPLHVVSRRAFDRRAGCLLDRWRKGAGVQVHRREGGLTGVLRALRRGEVVGVLADQDTAGEGVFAPFFGTPARTPTGPFMLARRTGALLLPIWIHMDAAGIHRVRVHPGEEPHPDKDSAEACRQDATRWNRHMERSIRSCPEQWVWFHRRWKSTPPAELPERRQRAKGALSRWRSRRFHPMNSGGALILLGLLCGVLLGGSGCLQSREEPGEPPARGRPTEGMRSVRLQNYRVGMTRWVLHADTASVYRDSKKLVARAVTIDFFEEEEHVSKLTADEGTLHQASDDLEVRGDVVMESDDGVVLETDLLLWDHGASRIHTESFVKILREEDVLTGWGLEADPGLDRVEILKDVRGTLRSEPEEILDEDEQGDS